MPRVENPLVCCSNPMRRLQKRSVLLIMTGSHARWVADNGEASAWSAMKMIIWFCFERSCLLAKPSLRVKNEGIRAGQVVSEGIEAEWKLSAEINIFGVLILLMDYNE